MNKATEQFTAGEATYPAGSYVVSLAQPAKRMIRTLLDVDVPMEAEFLKIQEARRKRKLPDEIYDIAGWSLPLLYNVECIERNEVSTGAFEDVKAGMKLAGSVTGNQPG